MTQLINGNQVTLLCNGADYFPALLTEIRASQHEVYLQTYIFELDETGLQVGKALMQAAKRKVSVFLLLDGFGCRNLSKIYIEALKKSGVQVLFFRPKISPWTLKRSRLRRLHSKLVVIDGLNGFVGGVNIIDDFNTPSHVAPRIDYAVKVQGPLLTEMHATAKRIWRNVCLRQFVHIPTNDLAIKRHPKQAGEMQATFLIRDNVQHRRDIENAYLSAMDKAQSEIIIANAYFLPGLRFRHALRDAAKRGVRVVLLLQKRSEYRLLDFATRALYSALLQQGVHIYEYHKSFMHSKVAVFDDRLAIVGSSNIDPFSLFLSLESNIAISNHTFAKALKQDLKMTIEAGATMVTLDDWHQNHLVNRLLSWLAYASVKVMTGIIGYREK